MFSCVILYRAAEGLDFIKCKKIVFVNVVIFFFPFSVPVLLVKADGCLLDL